MAINTSPIFTSAPVTTIVRLTGQAAYTGGTPAGYDLSGATAGTNAFLVFTADATYGSYVQKIRWRSLGTNVATVCRVFLNNGSTIATAANNALIDEISLAATTASTSAATALYELPINAAIAPGYKIYVTYGTANASVGWDVCTFGGNYTAQ